MTKSQTENYKSVADFYSGRSVFITGGTGFLGKAYVEKLVYECRQVDKIYILIRVKKGLDLEQRIKKYLDQPFFARIKQERSEAIAKITPVLGDITLPNLGLSDEDQQTLTNKVSVVIHCAASIQFNQVLKDAIRINVEGTNRVLNLAKLMKNVCVFVYVSTAYSNPNVQELEEVLYPPPGDLEDITKIAMRHYILGDDDKEIVNLLQGHANTYTFSKALAEHVVATNRGHLATIIIRPAMISAAQKEPIPGWVDNLAAATGPITFVSKGWIHALLSRDDNVMGLVPLDYVASLTIVATSRVPLKPGLVVYNSCTSATNPITVKNICDHIKQYRIEHNIDQTNFGMVLTEHKIVVSAVTCLMHTLPAFLADVWLRCKGREPKYLKLQSRITHSRDVMDFFCTHCWKVKCDGARALLASLDPQDQERFPCDPSLLNWKEYLDNYLMGIESYLTRRQSDRQKQ